MLATLNFENLSFYGYHGIHEEEALVGNLFTVSVKAQLNTDYRLERPSLSNTVDYEKLHASVKEAFSRREPLIESVALNIYAALSTQFPQVIKWEISVEKHNPLGAGTFNPRFCLSDF